MSAIEVIREIECLPDSEVKKVLEWCERRAGGERRAASLSRIIELVGPVSAQQWTEDDVLNWPRRDTRDESTDRR